MKTREEDKEQKEEEEVDENLEEDLWVIYLAGPC